MKLTVAQAKVVHDLLVALAVFTGALALSDHVDRSVILAAATLAVKTLARRFVVGEDAPGESA
jgi:hypothetical protein